MNCKLCASVLAIIFIEATSCLNAAVLTVTSLADSGTYSLRGQVAASSAGDTIQFAVTGTILFSSAISITHSLTIQGPGPAALVVDGNAVDRVFVTSGTSTIVISGMTISNGLAVGTPGVDGGPGTNGTDGGNIFGGAIYDQGYSLTLSDCWLVHNVAEAGPGGRGGDAFGNHPTPGNGGNGGMGEGGAVYSTSATVVVTNCTFSDNLAAGGPGGNGGSNIGSYFMDAGGTGGQGGGGQAGAIQAQSAPAAYVNCTFSANRASGGQGGAGGDNTLGGPGGMGGNGNTGSGGAIAAPGACSSWSCTIVSNSAFAGTGGPGGAGTPPGPNGTGGTGLAGGVVGYTLTCNCGILNTILADNFASTSFSNYFISFNDQGYNFIGTDDGGCPWYPASKHDQVGTTTVPIHPQLGPLAQNGGGLPTHATTLTSPVTDAGNSAGLTTDERGAPRPYVWGLPEPPGGDGSDIGAFELGSADLGLGAAGNNVVVSWPAYYGDFVLQSATNLQGSNSWSNVPDAPVVLGNQFVVTNHPARPVQFYRLVNQAAQ